MAVSLNRTFNTLKQNSEYARIINYSKRESNEYCFVELYNIFASYMKDILKEMYLLKPKRIIGHTKISIPNAIADEAMMYLLMRHLIIHNNSKVDQDYYNKYHNVLLVEVDNTIPAIYANL